MKQQAPEFFATGQLRVGAPLKREKQVGHLDASGWMVNRQSDLLEETLDFVRIFLKDEHYAHYHNSTSADGDVLYRMPCCRRSINEAPDFWIADFPEVYDTAYMPAFDVGISTSRKHIGYDEVRSYLYGRIVEQAMYRIKADQDILDWCAGEMDKITERWMKELA
jgi:hypothetical protein